MKEFVLPAKDQRPIQATHFAPDGQAGEMRDPIVIAAATGTPQRFYRGFAEFMAGRGRHVVTFDFRGIGRDRPKSLRGFRASFIDWAQLDLDAVVGWAAQHGAVDLVGHSFGAQALGHLSHKDQVRSLVGFGMGSGHHSFMKWTEQIKVHFLWHVLAPALAGTYGYLPSSLVGIGEDLPLGVYHDWKRWCNFPRYWFSDPAVDFKPRFAAVRSRVLSVSAEDDAWAPHSSTDMYASHYTGAQVDKLRLAPRELGVRAIGHMGFFRRELGPKIWPQIHAWWEKIGPTAPVGALATAGVP